MRSVFVDTNIWVYLSRKHEPLHLPARHKLEELANAGCELVICSQVIREYWRVMSTDSAITPSQLKENQDFIRAKTSLLLESSVTLNILVRLCQQYGVKGRQVFDTNLVNRMLEHGIPQLLTNNPADFQRFVGDNLTLLPLQL